jgi:hypothetical protein
VVADAETVTNPDSIAGRRGNPLAGIFFSAGVAHGCRRPELTGLLMGEDADRSHDSPKPRCGNPVESSILY